MRNRIVNPNAMQLRKAEGTAGYIETETGEETLIPAGFLVGAISELVTIQKRYLRELENQSLEVDEYSPQTIAGASGTVFTVTPQFSNEYFERIDHIIITGPAQGTFLDPFEGSAAAPGANANVLSIAASALPPPGNYTVNWRVALDGTPAAADQNNFKLVFGVVIANDTNDPVVGQYPQLPAVITILPGNTNALTVKAIGAATAGTTYSATLSLTPLNGFPIALQLGDRYWPNLQIPPTGVLELSPKKLILSFQDVRILTATFPGVYSLELLGTADVRNRFT